MESRLFLVFDVEAVGLHGEGFAVGAVVIDSSGRELDRVLLSCPSDTAVGTDADRAWVAAHIPALTPATCASPKAVRAAFWDFWQRWREHGATLVADCGWPVEARFLAACVDDDPQERASSGPYPLHELASALTLRGKDPLAIYPRLPSELPVHHPLADARQSARLWASTLRVSS